MHSILTCGADQTLDLATPVVMGILNITPDSFSDGGAIYSGSKPDVGLALSRAAAMVKEGARIIDIGGESTRPGASPVSVQEELDRVIPIIEAVKDRLDVVISIDTSKPEVMTQASHAGAGLINDVRALQLEGALAAASETGLPVCLMHMQGEPGDYAAKSRISECD